MSDEQLLIGCAVMFALVCYAAVAGFVVMPGEIRKLEKKRKELEKKVEKLQKTVKAWSNLSARLCCLRDNLLAQSLSMTSEAIGILRANKQSGDRRFGELRVKLEEFRSKLIKEEGLSFQTIFKSTSTGRGSEPASETDVPASNDNKENPSAD